MKVTLESTTKMVLVKTSPVEGVIECRVWEGQTESGIRVSALIPRIAAAEGEDLTQFAEELKEQRAPSGEINCWPLRLVL